MTLYTRTEDGLAERAPPSCGCPSRELVRVADLDEGARDRGKGLRGRGGGLGFGLGADRQGRGAAPSDAERGGPGDAGGNLRRGRAEGGGDGGARGRAGSPSEARTTGVEVMINADIAVGLRTLSPMRARRGRLSSAREKSVVSAWCDVIRICLAKTMTWPIPEASILTCTRGEPQLWSSTDKRGPLSHTSPRN